MSQPTPDGRAVVRALDALTTQVKRIADHTAQASFALAPPVVDTDDDVATTADDAVYCPLCPEAPLLLTPADATDHFRTVHPGQRLLGAGPWPQLATNDAATTCRRMETRTCPPSYNGPCGGRPCARFESDDPGPWLDTVAAPAADEDAQRTTRRASLHNLIVRATQGALTTDECAMLWRHVEAEQREADTARAVAAGNKRHVQLLTPALERAEADANHNADLVADAVSRADTAERELRVLRSGLRANGADPTQIQNLWAQIRLRNRQWRDAKRERDEAQAAIKRVRDYLADLERAGWSQAAIARRILAALDGTEQPTTTKEN